MILTSLCIGKNKDIPILRDSRISKSLDLIDKGKRIANRIWNKRSNTNTQMAQNAALQSDKVGKKLLPVAYAQETETEESKKADSDSEFFSANSRSSSDDIESESHSTIQEDTSPQLHADMEINPYIMPKLEGQAIPEVLQDTSRSPTKAPATPRKKERKKSRGRSRGLNRIERLSPRSDSQVPRYPSRTTRYLDLQPSTQTLRRRKPGNPMHLDDDIYGAYDAQKGDPEMRALMQQDKRVCY